MVESQSLTSVACFSLTTDIYIILAFKFPSIPISYMMCLVTIILRLFIPKLAGKACQCLYDILCAHHNAEVQEVEMHQQSDYKFQLVPCKLVNMQYEQTVHVFLM